MKAIPLFRSRPGKGGGKRYFWQPSDTLKAQGWKLIRLSDDLATAREEARQWNAKVDRWRAQTGGVDKPRRVIDERSMRALIVDYQGSRFFRDLRASTRENYHSYCRLIDRLIGDAPVASITPAHVEAIYTSMWIEVADPERPNGEPLLKPTAKASSSVKMLQVLFKHAILLGWRESNPAEKRGLKTPERQHQVVLWTPEMVRRFVAVADRLGRHSVGTAVMINEWMGQREADILKLPAASFAGLATDIRQQKTSAQVRLPVRLVPHLARRIDDESERRRSRKVTQLDPRKDAFILSENTGRPYVRFNFTEWVGKIAKVASDEAHAEGEFELAAELRLARFCWLRHTAVTRMAEADCTLPQIAEVTGHSLRGIAEIIKHYLVRTGKMAEAAFRKRLAADGLGDLADRLLDEDEKYSPVGS